MSGVLERILADKRRRLARGEYSDTAPAARASDGPRFVRSLSQTGVRIVAEFKATSPSSGQIVPAADGIVLDSRSGDLRSQLNRATAKALPSSSAKMKPGKSMGWIPEKVSVNALATATAG